jgi:hypothetical protein
MSQTIISAYCLAFPVIFVGMALGIAFATLFHRVEELKHRIDDLVDQIENDDGGGDEDPETTSPPILRVAA